MSAPVLTRAEKAKRRLRVNLTMAELRRLVMHLDRPLNWFNVGYIYEATRQMHPGRYRVSHAANGRSYQRDYWYSAPTESADKALHRLGVPYPPEWVLEAFEAGMRKARRRRKKSFVNADTAGDMLAVTKDELDALGLNQINAVDFRKADREARRKEKRRERDRERRATDRQRTRAEYEAGSLTSLEPWKVAGMSRASFYRRPKVEQDRLTEQARARETSGAANIYPKDILCLAAQPVSPNSRVSDGAAPSGCAPSELVERLPSCTTETVPQESAAMYESPKEALLRTIAELGLATDSPLIQRAGDDLEQHLADCPDAVRATVIHPAALAVRAHLALGLPIGRDLAVEAMMAA